MKLEINEPEQVKLLSMHLQDAIVRVGDIAFLKPQRRFALVVNRLCWEDCPEQRIWCGFHFDGVEAVRYRHLNLEDKEGFYQLLAVCFEPSPTPPAGILRLIFSGKNEIELQVEAVQASLQDMGETWQVKTRPQHE